MEALQAFGTAQKPLIDRNNQLGIGDAFSEKIGQ